MARRKVQKVGMVVNGVPIDWEFAGGKDHEKSEWTIVELEQVAFSDEWPEGTAERKQRDKERAARAKRMNDLP